MGGRDRQTLWWVGILGLAAACAAPPRVGPFVEATVEVRSAVATAGSAVEAELLTMEGGEGYAAQFGQLWLSRLRAMNALVAYAESLQAVAEAGQEGPEAVGSVADGVSRLATAAGIALPASGTVAVATDAAKFVYQQIALARAARSLAEALTQAQPAVEQIAIQIALDLRAAADVFVAANADRIRKVTEEHNVGLGFRQELLDEQNALYARGAGNLSEAQSRRLLEIGGLLDSTRSWYDPMVARLDRLAERERTGNALFASALDAVGQWGTTHNALALAVRENRAVNTHALIQASAEVRELIRRMREL